MADYYPLIARGVSGLEKNTGEARRALYERARTALVAQLRGMNPPLTEAEITRERLGLEEAIRKVEAEAARRVRLDPPKAEPPPKTPEPPAAQKPPAPAAPGENGVAQPAASRPATEARNTGKEDPDAKDAKAAKDPKDTKAAKDGAAAPAAPAPETAEAEKPRRRLFEKSHLTDKGLKGFRDVIAEAEAIGGKTAEASKAAREVYAAVPTATPELDRIEPRLEPGGPRPPARDPRRPADPPAKVRDPARPLEPPTLPRPPEPPMARQGDGRPPPRRPTRRGGPDVAVMKPPPRSRSGLIAALLSLVIIFGLGAAAIWQHQRIAAFFGAVRGLQTRHDAQPQRPKIPDRIGQEGQPSQPQGENGQVAAVAQRVVLYEEDPAEPSGKRYTGSAIWRTEQIKGAEGKPPETAIRCDVEIPERRIGMTLSLRRNTDQTLPASHTIEIMFNLPADFPFGGINNVPGLLMKQAEQTRGAPLSGLTVKVTPGFFLIGLSAVETEMQRNIQLLKERAWFDIPVVYNNGRRAIIAVEKGTPGEKVFAEAFKIWGQ